VLLRLLASINRDGQKLDNLAETTLLMSCEFDNEVKLSLSRIEESINSSKEDSDNKIGEMDGKLTQFRFEFNIEIKTRADDVDGVRIKLPV
jgi:hypothetical protein